MPVDVLDHALVVRAAELAQRLDARNVELPGPLEQDRLTALYQEASAGLYLSEHEGFCIPLVEAFHFGLPVIARPVGGMIEVAKDAALWTDEEPDLAVVAELLGLTTRDDELRAELVARGRRRLEEFSREKTEAKLRAAVEAAAA